MPKFFIEPEQIKEDKIIFEGKDVKHIKNVLRKKQGDTLFVGNKKSLESYLCEIDSFEQEKMIASIKEKRQERKNNIHITLFQGLPKADKMEQIIQKTTELGIETIVPTQMKRAVVKLTEKEKLRKQQRWQTIAEVACKQCGRNTIPTIQEVVPFSQAIERFPEYDVVLLAYEKEEKVTLKEQLQNIKKEAKQSLYIAIIVGPEGGLEPEEVEMLIQKGAKSITLGKRILRTETVGMLLTGILMYELENEEERK